ncbi:stage II sporulation protein M [Candidatus Woesearchaeota archaeon]|nr:stage II sporulation protein M [Candidatus Woesearchaeota archaeon]
MVFEQIYSSDFLRKRPSAGFLLGVAYTIMGLFLAITIFREDPALIAVGITALLCIPSLYRLSANAELQESKTKTVLEFLKLTFPYLKIYVFIFFGIFFTFAGFAIFLPKLAAGHLFAQQLAIVTGGHAAGGASFSWSLFSDLFVWNLQVLLLCFILSLVAGNGAILFIAWNASVWGTIFGNLAKTAALASGLNSLILFLLIIVSVFPHTFLEGLSYMVSTLSGTGLSDGLVKEKIMSNRMFIIAKYNLLLFLISLSILCIACMIETYVLNNFTTYRMIINLAFAG